MIIELTMLAKIWTYDLQVTSSTLLYWSRTCCLPGRAMGLARTNMK